MGPQSPNSAPTDRGNFTNSPADSPFGGWARAYDRQFVLTEQVSTTFVWTLGSAMYNCKKCPGYCCSYPLIALNKRDVERLAKHFRLTFRQAKAKFTVERWGAKYSMRRKKDHIFGGVCRFFDTEKRCCTVYESRPSLCRSFPGGRCGYYDFLAFERRAQEDPEFIATTNNK